MTLLPAACNKAANCPIDRKYLAERVVTAGTIRIGSEPVFCPTCLKKVAVMLHRSRFIAIGNLTTKCQVRS